MNTAMIEIVMEMKCGCLFHYKQIFTRHAFSYKSE